MSFKDQFKIFMQEAEIYKNQGLVEEARLKYQNAKEMIQANEQLGNRDALIQTIESKLANLKSDTDSQSKETALPQLPPNGVFSEGNLEALKAEIEYQLASQGVEMELPEIKTNISSEAGGALSAPEDSSEDGQVESIDIISIEIPMDAGPKKGQVLGFDVDFQADNILTIIIPKKDKSQITHLNDGFRLNKIMYYSPIAIFRGDGVVKSCMEINEGPKKGDYCLDIKIVNQ